jgi:hypothetical protein
MLERKGVETAEQAVAQGHLVDLLHEQLALTERRIGPGERDTLDVEGDAHAVDPGDPFAVEEVLPKLFLSSRVKRMARLCLPGVIGSSLMNWVYIFSRPT